MGKAIISTKPSEVRDPLEKAAQGFGAEDDWRITAGTRSEAWVAWNAIFPAWNARFRALNATFCVWNTAFVAQNKAFVAQNEAFVAQNRAFVAQITAFFARFLVVEVRSKAT